MRGDHRRSRLVGSRGGERQRVMSDTDQSGDDTPASVPASSSWAERQKDIGGALLIGALTVAVLLGLLVWKGLF